MGTFRPVEMTRSLTQKRLLFSPIVKTTGLCGFKQEFCPDKREQFHQTKKEGEKNAIWEGDSLYQEKRSDESLMNIDPTMGRKSATTTVESSKFSSWYVITQLFCLKKKKISKEKIKYSKIKKRKRKETIRTLLSE